MATWNPWIEFSWTEREIGRMFDEFWDSPTKRGIPALTARVEGLPAQRETTGVGTPRVDLVDRNGFLILKSEIPGVKKKDMRVTVTDEEVSLSGKVEDTKEEKKDGYYYCERVHSSWERTVPLPVKIESNKAKATYKNGVLEITLPKSKEAKDKSKEIKIE